MKRFDQPAHIKQTQKMNMASNRRLRTGKQPARKSSLSGVPAPAGAVWARPVQKLQRTPGRKLKIFFDQDSQVELQVPVAVKPSGYEQPGATQMDMVNARWLPCPLIIMKVNNPCDSTPARLARR